MTPNGGGNLAAAESKSGFTSETGSTFWVKAIEVLTATSPGAIVALGDSITDGTCSSYQGHNRWVDWLGARLVTDYGSGAKAVVNEGIGGNTLTPLRSNPATSRFTRDVLSHTGVSDCLRFLGTTSREGPPRVR